MRTKKQIDAEIKVLRDYEIRVKPGVITDNRAAIAAQIRVLEEEMDEDTIYDEWSDEEREAEIRQNACVAMEWMMGDSEMRPSSEWKPLLN